MVAIPANTPGTGVGVSGPAYTEQGAGAPRPRPSGQQSVTGTPDGPSTQELRAAWRAYCGLFADERAASDGEGPLTRQPHVPDLNILSNRIKPIVNAGVDLLFGPALAIAVDDDAAQKILDAAWGDDDLRMTLLSKAGINGGVYGHVFFKVVPPKRGKPSVLNPPRLVLLNPEMLSVETDPDDADLVSRFCIEYATTDPASGAPQRRRQTITRLDPDDDDDSTANGMDTDTSWQIQDWVATSLSGNHWREDGPAKPWAYELPPIVDWQNYPNPNSHWGQADVTPSLIALSRQLRLVESNINKIGYLQGHPYVWSVGTDTKGISGQLTPGRILDLENPDAKLNALSAAGDLAQLMAFADQIRSDMDEESGIPGVALGRLKDLPRGQVSGISMRLLHASALARTEHKRRLYGQGIRQVCQTVLVLCGMPLDKALALDIKLTWQDPLPSDDFNEAQAWQIKVQSLGYSQTTAIEETNGNPDLEHERKQEEPQQQMLAFAHGTGQPPMDASALDQSAQMSGPDEGQPPPPSSGQQQQQANQERAGKPAAASPPPPPRQPINPNHPAAQVAGAKMKAAFGKPVS